MLPNDYRGLGFALVTAAAKGDLGRVQACIDAGVNVNFEDDLALRCTAFTDNFPVMQFLADKGGDIHAKDEEALFYAVKRQDTDMTKFLLSRGADVEQMMKHHGAGISGENLAVLDRIRAEPQREAFEKNYDAFQKNTEGFKKITSRFKPPRL